MIIEDIINELDGLKKDINSFRTAMNEDELKKAISEVDNLSMSDPNFWNSKESKVLMKEQAINKKKLEEWHELTGLLEDTEVLIELYKEGEQGVEADIETSIRTLEKTIAHFELKLVLSGQNDGNNAIITINSGAGGTEANDWAAMLYRMYTHYAERNGYKCDILDYMEGEEAGIKNATINIKGAFTYGYLKGETGVHRLVRISPYDSANRRHTSFAAVFVMPEIEDDIEIDISEADLHIDTYRASGAGGQHVNTTDSAVRITHVPTGTVVTCQSERSQHKNKAHAMKILKSRLYELEIDKKNEEKQKLESTKTEIGWGNQIRSYVMHPYKMVKDLRTRHETGNVDAVMDGNLDAFIRAYLLHTAGINTDEQ
ncbi:peptide chain release factor 2 [Denitrovibrio acetiphilus DSM 12809]|uniref:Peptide chain release factor 2 n=1 Tax=Denitrovibrio acetiphilus (strain DSM 12809 / NBRC 114555 / N2460) TaxID=522772 RepID=D4H828_DENA2|nr:peptide chain release factor 2 [Denitrovibrio acetiphilus]ADD68177.1 peptide chain release factor 2 [Denitrovibrio acetiphilus DSM 12809]